MSERFYLNSPLQPGPVELEGPEAHHLATVSRLRPGDPLCLFTGDGREYPARVLSVARKSVTAEVVDVLRPERELPFLLEVAAPLPKGDRAQFLVEKLTELGVTSYVPLLTQRTVVQPREGKRDKLHRYVIEASKQCGRNVLMDVADPAKWGDYVAAREPGEVRLLAHSGGEGGLRSVPAAPRYRLAFGPEGGFTDGEVELARAAGWQLIDLGPRILRIETAALAMSAQLIARVV